MQSELLQELAQSLDSRLLLLIIQFVMAGVFIMYLKDWMKKIFDFIKVKWSDFGRGTKVEIDGHIGHIKTIDMFKGEIEIRIDAQTVMIVPSLNFFDLPSNSVFLISFFLIRIFLLFMVFKGTISLGPTSA